MLVTVKCDAVVVAPVALEAQFPLGPQPDKAHHHFAVHAREAVVREERAFLLRLAHNLAIDLIRRRTARDRNYERLAGENLSAFAPAANPDERAFREALSAALADLPAEQWSGVEGSVSLSAPERARVVSEM